MSEKKGNTFILEEFYLLWEYLQNAHIHKTKLWQRFWSQHRVEHDLCKVPLAYSRRHFFSEQTTKVVNFFKNCALSQIGTKEWFNVPDLFHVAGSRLSGPDNKTGIRFSGNKLSLFTLRFLGFKRWIEFLFNLVNTKYYSGHPKLWVQSLNFRLKEQTFLAARAATDKKYALNNQMIYVSCRSWLLTSLKF